MADKTTGELQAVKVGDLPIAPDIYDDTLIPVEQQGDAKHITGAQFKGYAVSASVEAARQFAESVKEDATAARNAADRAESIRESITVDQSKLSQAVSSASASAANAKVSESNAKTSEGNAKESETAAQASANRAQAEADRATVPAVAGVYNVILTDRVTGARYALIVENGRLALLGVSETLEATDMNFIDTATGRSYKLIVVNGRLNTEEV